MKKIFAFGLAAVMLLSLAACGQDVPENDEAGSNPSQQVGAPSASGNPENAGTNQQVAQQFLVDLPEDDGSGLGDMADTASYAGAAAEKKVP